MIKYLAMYFHEFWIITCQMAPWLLTGFMAAGILSVIFSPSIIKKHIGGKGFFPILKAALFGVPLPLCSCGVIPVTASLRKQGAERGAAGAFLISTPQTGIDSIIVTWNMLGPVFAIFKPIIALITGIIGGALIEKFGDKDQPPAAVAEKPDCSENCQESGECGSCAEKCSECSESICPICNALHYAFFILLGDIALSLLAGLFLAAAISLAVPADFAVNYLKSDWLAMPAMILFGIPLYVCSTASIPIAAVLIAKGLSPGAALVFLITGPATNIATISAMLKILGKKSTAIYLIVVAAASVIAGMFLNLISIKIEFISEICHIPGDPSPFSQIAAIVLLTLITIALLKNVFKSITFKRQLTPDEFVMHVSGMTCSHCQRAVETALLTVPGIMDVEVDLLTGSVVIIAEKPALLFPEIKAVLENAGFSCTEQKEQKK